MLEGAICREACQHSPKAYWAWRRLGFIQVLKFSEALKRHKVLLMLPILYDFGVIEEGESFYGSSCYLCVRDLLNP